MISRRAKRDIKFGVGWVIITLIGLCIFPGIDIAAYLFLRPLVGFWEKIVFIAAVFLTAWPFVILAFFVWGLLTAVWLEFFG